MEVLKQPAARPLRRPGPMPRPVAAAATAGGPRGPRSACAGRPCRGGPRREPAEVEVRVGVGCVADLDARVLEGLVGFEVHELRAEQARGPVQRVPERVRERVGARGSKCSPRWTSCRGRAALSGSGTPARGRRRRSRPAPRRDVRAGARRAAVSVVGRLLARHPRPHRAVRRAVGGCVGHRLRTPSGPSRSGRGRRVAPRAPGPGSDARSSHAEKSDEWRRCQSLSTIITSWFRASRTAGFESRSYFGPETGARRRDAARGAAIEFRSEARGAAQRVLDEDQVGRA